MVKRIGMGIGVGMEPETDGCPVGPVGRSKGGVTMAGREMGGRDPEVGDAAAGGEKGDWRGPDADGARPMRGSDADGGRDQPVMAASEAMAWVKKKREKDYITY